MRGREPGEARPELGRADMTYTGGGRESNNVQPHGLENASRLQISNSDVKEVCNQLWTETRHLPKTTPWERQYAASMRKRGDRRVFGHIDKNAYGLCVRDVDEYHILLYTHYVLDPAFKRVNWTLERTLRYFELMYHTWFPTRHRRK